jgi:cupin fold WbuC family metalloprotein
MVRIENDLMQRVVNEAVGNARRRKHFNFHKSYDETVQRLLNAIEPGSYIRPHMHRDPDKLEVFLVLKGRLLVIEFEEDGSIREHFLLDPKTGNVGVEIHPGNYHMVIALDPGSVAYEVKNGPFDPNSDKRFALWAPEEGTEEGLKYLERITDLVLNENNG